MIGGKALGVGIILYGKNYTKKIKNNNFSLKTKYWYVLYKASESTINYRREIHPRLELPEP